MIVDERPTTMQIYRGADAIPLGDAKIMSMHKITDIQRAGFAGMFQPGMPRGEEVEVLFSAPGFSLTYVWFKKDFPLPLHSHDCDCLYYIIAGSIRLGTEELGAKDGFFLPSGVPYTYKIGPQGVELLEFRHATTFDFDVKSNTEAYWNRTIATIKASTEDWNAAKRPSAVPA